MQKKCCKKDLICTNDHDGLKILFTLLTKITIALVRIIIIQFRKMNFEKLFSKL